jgi:hypothetical protein
MSKRVLCATGVAGRRTHTVGELAKKLTQYGLLTSLQGTEYPCQVSIDLGVGSSEQRCATLGNLERAVSSVVL